MERPGQHHERERGPLPADRPGDGVHDDGRDGDPGVRAVAAVGHEAVGDGPHPRRGRLRRGLAEQHLTQELQDRGNDQEDRSRSATAYVVRSLFIRRWHVDIMEDAVAGHGKGATTALRVASGRHDMTSTERLAGCRPS
jgi:hypothetical protein